MCHNIPSFPGSATKASPACPSRLPKHRTRSFLRGVQGPVKARCSFPRRSLSVLENKQHNTHQAGPLATRSPKQQRDMRIGTHLSPPNISAKPVHVQALVPGLLGARMKYARSFIKDVIRTDNYLCWERRHLPRPREMLF